MAGGDDWWEPKSFPLALAVALVSTACWGTWSNTAKAAGSRINFAHFYTDFCIGTVLASLVFWGALGRFNAGHSDVNLANIGYASAAGALFGVANLLLTTGIKVVGLSIAFPLCIGTALVLGTILTYVVDPRGKPELIFPGVALALLGVIANARAYGLMQQQAEGRDAAAALRPADAENNSEAPSPAAPEKGGALRNMIMCIIGGVLMSCWAPLSAQGMKGDRGLSPYCSFVCFTVAALLVGMAILVGQQNGCALMPRVDPITTASEYFKVPLALHCWGLLGGAIWALGTASNLVSGQPLGPALSYALGQTAPLVAVLWGLGWYREFDGAPRSAAWLIVAMFVLFIAAISLLCASTS